MALTVSVSERGTARSVRMHTCLVTFDSSYTTGGLALSGNSVGMNTISAIICSGASNGNQIAYDIATGKLKAFTTSATEVSNATDLSTMTVQILAVGR